MADAPDSMASVSSTSSAGGTVASNSTNIPESSSSGFGGGASVPVTPSHSGEGEPRVLKGRWRHLSILPNVFTSLNLFCGYLSILFTSRQEFLEAGWMIVLAVICDILDGRLARLTSVSSRFGAELDSLADLVSFGVAPAFLVYSRYLSDYRFIGLISTSMFVLCGALRLARFNITPPSEKDVFIGLPIPAGAGILITLTIFEMQFVQVFRVPDVIIPVVVIITSLLMVSQVEYPAMKKSKRTGPQRQLLVLVFVFGLVLAPAVSLFCFSWGFAIYGLMMFFLKKFMGFFRRRPIESGALSTGGGL